MAQARLTRESGAGGDLDPVTRHHQATRDAITAIQFVPPGPHPAGRPSPHARA